MIFSWFRNRRRKQLVSQPFPKEWEVAIRENVVHIEQLSTNEYEKLQGWMQIFIAEKYWEGYSGLKVTPEMQATIAAQAGFLVRGLSDYYFDHLRSILICPDMLWRKNLVSHGGIVNEDPTAIIGDAWQSGPVRLVWPHVLAGGRGDHDGHNVVFHEFAHVLDGQDQFLDGTPHLDSADLYQRWETTFNAEFAALTEAVRHRQPTVIDYYGATNIAEFFAVSTECFFERPNELARHHPDWFGLLQEFYNVNPLKTVT